MENADFLKYLCPVFFLSEDEFIRNGQNPLWKMNEKTITRFDDSYSVIFPAPHVGLCLVEFGKATAQEKSKNDHIAATLTFINSDTKDLMKLSYKIGIAEDGTPKVTPPKNLGSLLQKYTDNCIRKHLLCLVFEAFSASYSKRRFYKVIFEEDENNA